MVCIAKVLVVVEDQNKNYILMSSKRAPRHPQKNMKLELLGGHLETDERALDALVRELAEEESTGFLAKYAKAANPAPFKVDVAGTTHFLFRLTIQKDEFDRLIADAEESFGFKLVPYKHLFEDAIQNRLTKRTRAILKAFKRIDAFQPIIQSSVQVTPTD
ncbi:MAG: NUDIX hydrolase [Deltaproteobacteria bacterium]|nr:NUDIX hydrolase [Deltaproteobacteria bacterium]MBN2671416.1 NUDIX hydrolase [Deltaproteobacteria bacterium]